MADERTEPLLFKKMFVCLNELLLNNSVESAFAHTRKNTVHSLVDTNSCPCDYDLGVNYAESR